MGNASVHRLANACGILCLATLNFAPRASAQKQPWIEERDRVRLAEAFRLGEKLGDEIWPGWNQAPFAVLLVTPDYEFLLRHPKPSEDFVRLGHDDLLASDVYYRQRTLGTNLLATFPAVGGISTIVAGQAENTGSKNSTRWVLTLLHEHFHQLQDSQPGMFAETQALNLAHGDKTGMWMLNYPFPYEKPETAKSFGELIGALQRALEARGKERLEQEVQAYLAKRKEFAAGLGEEDYKYLSFQLWKEGMARYTEYKIARLAAEKYQPSEAFRGLADFQAMADAAKDVENGIVGELKNVSLPGWKRVAFYNLGASEGLLLDEVRSGWQRRYFREKFFAEKYFEP